MRFFWIFVAFWVGVAATSTTSATSTNATAFGDISFTGSSYAPGGESWNAVGKLNIAGKAFCTGSLIAPDLVLTAAHCLFDKSDGHQFYAHQIEFLAGWRDGQATARRQVVQALPHPGYEYTSNLRQVRIAADVALLRLEMPVELASVTPFETYAKPRKGASVGVVSYARGRAHSPLFQDACQVLARRSGTLVLSCEVEFGASGSPVFTFDESGAARIVSVISAKAEIGGRIVSLGTNLKGPLEDLMQLIDRSEIEMDRLAVASIGAKSRRP